jgi:hypothetical protein
MSGPRVTRVTGDFTWRLSCRQGDLLLWLQPPGGFFSGAQNSSWDMPDCWFFTDGSTALITNRSVDLPAWVELHPTETAGLLAFQTMKRLRDGWLPGEPVDAPNVWRIRAGDRVAFTGNRDQVSIQPIMA